MPTISLPDGTSIAYEAATGDAPIVVFIHGFLDDANVWDWVIEHLPGVVAIR